MMKSSEIMDTELKNTYFEKNIICPKSAVRMTKVAIFNRPLKICQILWWTEGKEEGGWSRQGGEDS